MNIPIANFISRKGKARWSYDKILIDWVRLGRTGKYLALGYGARTSLRSVRMPWPRAKYFPVRPSYSVNKYILSYLNPSFSAKMSDVSEHSDSEFYFPRKKKKKGKARWSYDKCLLTELGWAGRENIWPSVMAHGPRCARSVRQDLGPNIFPSGPSTQSISA